MIATLRERFTKLGAALGVDTSATWPKLLAAYQEPWRQYHNGEHIADCLRRFDGVQDHCHEPLSVELAIWFHDAVYRIGAPDNEARSADWAASLLRDERSATVRCLILATARHEPFDDDSALLCDIDLAILAEPTSVYQNYAEKIRREFAHLDDTTFAAGRSRVLEQLLARASIFSSGRFFPKFENAARENIRRELNALQETGAGGVQSPISGNASGQPGPPRPKD